LERNKNLNCGFRKLNSVNNDPISTLWVKLATGSAPDDFYGMTFFYQLGGGLLVVGGKGVESLKVKAERIETEKIRRLKGDKMGNIEGWRVRR